ncbi:hypothetical protein PMIN01_12796 [Paraphaeosphaeria minitans]|uniref:Uncharacterized protein n=1 Tax=Paraphaeosphaeria minitans TaxID=565426 RepID=A0A9P6G5P8_9PLEO|nr:hypothetical protein PMIN01_12796 [Paraphaeosphaeria minitans]
MATLYADAQRPTFTPLWAAGLSRSPVRVDHLARERADGAFLSRQGCVHFANPGAMPFLPEHERRERGCTTYAPQGWLAQLCLRRPFCLSTRASAPALPEAAPLGCIHALGSLRHAPSQAPNHHHHHPHHEVRIWARSILTTSAPTASIHSQCRATSAPRSYRKISRDALPSPVPCECNDMALATVQPLAKLLVPALVPET